MIWLILFENFSLNEENNLTLRVGQYQICKNQNDFVLLDNK